MATNYTNLTTNETTTAALDPFKPHDGYSRYDMLVQYIEFYLFALVIWPGLFFNILAFVCFVTSKTLRRTTTGHYLIALTCADFTFLVGDLLRWFNTLMNGEDPVLGMTFMDDFNSWCKIIYFLRYYGKLISSWITVVITVERFISIWYPLRAAHISTKKNARIIIIGTYFVCAAFTSFPFWVLGQVGEEGDKYCSFYNADVYNRWNWAINRVGSLLIPSAILFITTTLIVVKLKQIQKQRSDLINQNQNQKSGSIENQLTLMLVAVAVAFLLLRLPYTICYYLETYRNHFFHPVSKHLKSRLQAATGITDVIASANYSINFFLYCMSGTAFRSQFILLVGCKVQQLNRQPTASSPYTVSTSTGTSVRRKQTDFV